MLRYLHRHTRSAVKRLVSTNVWSFLWRHLPSTEHLPQIPIDIMKAVRFLRTSPATFHERIKVDEIKTQKEDRATSFVWPLRISALSRSVATQKTPARPGSDP
jgi:hypothetical protein